MSTQSVVSQPAPATCLIADLRNFTANLNAAPSDGAGVNEFCYFLGEFYEACLDCIDLSIPPTLRAQPPVSVSSTGDGVLALFFGPWHAPTAFLAAVLMNAALGEHCERYNRGDRHRGPDVDFGVGVESGNVFTIRAGHSFDTHIGHCVNVAARTEAVTKTLHDARTLFADDVVETVCRELFGRGFHDLRAKEAAESTDDDARLAIHDQLTELNRKLCVVYMSRHVLGGVHAPLHLYRLSRQSTRPGTPRFEDLLRRLTRDDEDHLAEIRHALQASQPAR